MAKWFETWFDSPYYHQLYKDRNNTEAEQFINNLVGYLKPDMDALFLDLACGKGRHAIQLNKLGLKVEGADYSENSIVYAKQFENERLHFYLQDMRLELPKKYDCILNLFTSFGYFDTKDEHLQTLKNIYKALKNEGIFVFDFLNLNYVKNHLVAEEKVIKDGIAFEIEREITDNQIIKKIAFKHEGGEYTFKEKVMALSKVDLEDMMHESGFKTVAKFGNYNLEPFNLELSKRLIFILKRDDGTIN